LLAAFLSLSGGDARAMAEVARFRIGSEVTTPALGPFAATITGIGNGSENGFNAEGSGFEPIILRDMFVATESAPNSVIVPPRYLDHWDSWREGALDGAEVEVLRIENGAFVSVRTDRVAPGGHRASGWIAETGNFVVPGGTTRYITGWSKSSRLDAPYFYAVQAVDRLGRVSPPSEAVRVMPPKSPGKLDGAQKEALTKARLTADQASDLAAPEHLTAQLTVAGTLALNWDPVPGAVGYVVLSSDYAPERHRGYGLDLAGTGPEVRAGDLVMIRQRILKPERTMLSNRMWGLGQGRGFFTNRAVRSWPGEPGAADWQLVPHEPGTPVPDAGETYLHADLKRGQTLELATGRTAGTGQQFYAVLDPSKSYRMEVWARGDPGVSVRFEARSMGRAAEFQPTAEWRRYSLEMTPKSLQTGPGVLTMSLTLSGEGGVDLDNLRIYRSDAPYLAWLPEDLEALRQSGFGALRTHDFVRTGNSSYDLAQLTNGPGGSGLRSGNTLPQTLTDMAVGGVDPWLQIEPHLSRAEWLGLAEFLAAPFDPARDDPAARPWAAKRAALGRPEPWTEAFGKIYLELGNETWNRLFSPWTFPPLQDGAPGASQRYTRGAVYGLYQEYVLSILRESPWWDRLAPKLVPVLGGWTGFDYGPQAARFSPHSQLMTQALYIGGWDSGEGPVQPTSEGYFSVMANAEQVAAPLMTKSAEDARRLSRQRAEPLGIGSYESGPGYALDGLNGKKIDPERETLQHEVMKGAAAGAAVLDQFLSAARAGAQVQNFFTFGRGEMWTSHAPWYRGGQAWPSWQWLSVFNRVGTGDMLGVETLEVPRRDIPKMRRREALKAAPLVAVYATRQGDRVTVFVINRSVPGLPGGGDGTVDVSVALPFGPARAVTRYAIAAPYTANNLEGPAAMVEGRAMTPPAGGDLEIPAMPPASAQAYVFEGVRF